MITLYASFGSVHRRIDPDRAAAFNRAPPLLSPSGKGGISWRSPPCASRSSRRILLGDAARRIFQNITALKIRSRAPSSPEVSEAGLRPACGRLTPHFHREPLPITSIGCYGRAGVPHLGRGPECKKGAAYERRLRINQA